MLSYKVFYDVNDISLDKSQNVASFDNSAFVIYVPLIWRGN